MQMIVQQNTAIFILKQKTEWRETELNWIKWKCTEPNELNW